MNRRCCGAVRVLLALTAFAASACAAHGRGPSETLSRPEPIRVQPGNVLRVQVWPDSSLGGDFPVEETGNVYLPLLGPVPIGGQPLPEIRAELRSLYDDAIRSAIVTVTPLFNVSVLGAVQRPGLYSVTPTTNLFDVISMAGGFATGARQDDVHVLRDGQVLEINAERAIRGGEAELALALRPGDRIIVPARRQFLTVGNVLSLAQSALLLVALWNQVRNSGS